MAKEKSIYELKVHEDTSIGSWIHVLRVPGGWIYQILCPPHEGTDFGVFVPFHTEVLEQQDANSSDS